jgi:hypothetical protein
MLTTVSPAASDAGLGSDDVEQQFVAANLSGNSLAASDASSGSHTDSRIDELEQQVDVVNYARGLPDYSLWVKTQIAVTRFVSPVLALFTTISLPIFIIYSDEYFSRQAKTASTLDILAPLLPWLFLATNRQWLVWNNVAQRANGLEDNEIQVASSVQRRDPLHVVIALIANVSSATNALLVAFSGLSDINPVVTWLIAIMLSALNYLSHMLTDLPATFRKHAEVCEVRGQAVLPLFEQPLVKFFYDRALYPAIVLREITPVLNGIIRSAATVSVLDALDAPAVLMAIVGVLMYCSTAYVITNFDIAQLKDSLHATGQEFELTNAWSRSPRLTLRLIGRFLSGQLLIDALKKCKLSTENSVNLTLSISALGLMAVVQRALHDYVSSDNSAAIEAGEQALITRFLAGPERAAEVGKDIEFVMQGTAVILGSLGTFKSWATVQKEARNADVRFLPQAPVAELVAR